MVAKHTPGPWSLSNEPVERDLRMWVYAPMGPNRPRIATISFGVFDGSAAQEYDAIVGNARLIAAAPDMLDALNAADEALAQFTAFEDDARHIMGNTNFAIVQMRRAQVRAAIAKALSTETPAPASEQRDEDGLAPGCPQ